LFIAALIVSRKAEKLVDNLAGKLWKFVLVPFWKMVGHKPGGKLWAVSQMIGGKSGSRV
jgi:hypothetical protein